MSDPVTRVTYVLMDPVMCPVANNINASMLITALTQVGPMPGVEELTIHMSNPKQYILTTRSATYNVKIQKKIKRRPNWLESSLGSQASKPFQNARLIDVSGFGMLALLIHVGLDGPRKCRHSAIGEFRISKCDLAGMAPPGPYY